MKKSDLKLLNYKQVKDLSNLNQRKLKTQQGKRRVSNITFLKDMSSTQTQRILQKGKNYYKSTQWSFAFNQGFDKNDPSEIFKAAQTILIERLTFHYCKNRNVLGLISHIFFPRLKSLSLTEIRIKSLQPLTWMDLQNIQFLDLRQSNCLSSKALSKTNLKNIGTITLPTLRIDGLQEFLKRNQLTQSVTRLFVNFEEMSNIYPFEQNWISDVWIGITGCGLQQQPRGVISKALEKRSQMHLWEYWFLRISNPY